MTDHTSQIKALLALGDKATQDELEVCHHLKSIEADSSCPCGYRGGIYGKPDHMVCEMGSTVTDGEEGLELPRYERAVEIANAQYIEASFNARPALKALVDHVAALEKQLAERDKFLGLIGMNSEFRSFQHKERNSNG